jgi:hypothetical protein
MCMSCDADERTNLQMILVVPRDKHQDTSSRSTHPEDDELGVRHIEVG